MNFTDNYTNNWHMRKRSIPGITYVLIVFLFLYIIYYYQEKVYQATFSPPAAWNQG